MYTKIKLPVLVLLLFITVSGYAANYPASFATTITVGKTGADFTSPIKALDSITNASETAPVLMKILPGSYDLVAETLQLKENVYIEGGGTDNTILLSAAVNVDNQDCAVATVKMADNSSLKKLRVVNSASEIPVNGSTAGIVFDNVKATVEGVKVIVGTDTVTARSIYGICSVGKSGNAVLNNVDVEVRNIRKSSALYLINDGSMTVSGSKLTAYTMENGRTRVIDCSNFKNMAGSLVLENSIAEGTVKGSDGVNKGLDVLDCRVTIGNSTIKLIGGNEQIGLLAGNNPVKIDNSKIFSNGKAVVYEGSKTISISNSVIQGELPLNTNLKLMNNTDENNKKIMNR